MSLKAVTAIAEASNSYKSYIDYLNDYKANRSLLGPMPERKMVRIENDVYYELLPGEVICRLPLWERDDEDVAHKTNDLCQHISDNTNNLRKHMMTAKHKMDKIGVQPGRDGGVTNDELAACRVFYKFWVAGQRDFRAATEQEEFIPGVHDVQHSQYTVDCSAADDARNAGVTEDEVAAATPTTPKTTRTTSRRPSLASAGPDLQPPPLYKSGPNKNKINYTAVKKVLDEANQRFPCVSCSKAGIEKGKNKEKGTRCDITRANCANRRHFYFEDGEEPEATTPTTSRAVAEANAEDDDGPDAVTLSAAKQGGKKKGAGKRKRGPGGKFV